MIEQPSQHEVEIQGQPAALRAFAGSHLPTELAEMTLAEWDRIILTGMGSSHCAALPTWQRLVVDGLPAWWLSTAQLLRSPELISANSLLIVTSQSGLSGEVTRLCAWLAQHRPAARVIAITNDVTSPLAQAASSTVALCADEEQTVSSKTYVNSLAAHDRVYAALDGRGDSEQVDLILRVAQRLETFDCAKRSASAVECALGVDGHVFGQFIAEGPDLATALWGGLILKEGARVPTEGHDVGEFRHGPQEIAQKGMLAVLFVGHRATEAGAWRTLAQTLTLQGATVLAVGDTARLDLPQAGINVPDEPLLLRLALGARVVEQLEIDLARARGLEPGRIRVGAKVTR